LSVPSSDSWSIAEFTFTEKSPMNGSTRLARLVSGTSMLSTPLMSLRVR